MSFSKEIRDLLAGFERYLEEGILTTAKNISKYIKRVEFFIKWCETKEIEQVSYTEIMEYIRYCRSLDMNPSNINRYLRAVRHFFDYENKEEHRYLNPIQDYNPAKRMQIKDVYHTIRVDYLEKEELEKLYESYKGKHKILLGLFVYQGLKVGEIERLEKIHFDLKKGTIYIPKTGKGNSRKLKLESVQLYELMEHILKIEADSLLGKPLQNQAQKLCKELRQINPKIRNSSHLRGSRISYWVRNYNLREAQYLAGHNTIAGTEKYRQVNLEDLQNQVNQFHPLS